jgi:hypothetical protein
MRIFGQDSLDALYLLAVDHPHWVELPGFDTSTSQQSVQVMDVISQFTGRLLCRQEFTHSRPLSLFTKHYINVPARSQV